MQNESALKLGFLRSYSSLKHSACHRPRRLCLRSSGWPHIIRIKSDSVVVVVGQCGIVRESSFVVLLIETVYNKIRDTLRPHVDPGGYLACRLQCRAVDSIGTLFSQAKSSLRSGTRAEHQGFLGRRCRVQLECDIHFVLSRQMNQQQRIWVSARPTAVELGWYALFGRNIRHDERLQLCGGEMQVMANLLQRYLDHFFRAIDANRIGNVQLLRPCVRL